MEGLAPARHAPSACADPVLKRQRELIVSLRGGESGRGAAQVGHLYTCASSGQVFHPQ